MNAIKIKKSGTCQNMSRILEQNPGSTGFWTFEVRNKIQNMTNKLVICQLH